MTTSWKIFACVLALAVATAIVMGTTSQSPKGHATLTGADGKGSADPNSVPFPAPPGDGVLPKNAPPPPPAQTKGQATPSIPSSPTPDATTASSPAPAPSSTSPAPTQTPSGVSSFSSQYSAPAEDQSSSESDVSQSTAPTETAAQRVGKKLRGR